MKFLIYMTITIIFASCTQKNPNPELLDVIYKDLVLEQAFAKRALEEEEKNLLSLLKEKGLAIPQTGQIKFANKKISDSQEKLIFLRQQHQYFEISVLQRADLARKKYEQSLLPNGAPWPDKDEVALYTSVAKFHRDKLAWEKNKGIKKAVPRGTEKKTN